MPLGANKAAIMGVAGTAAAADVVLLNEGAFSDETTVSFTSSLTSTYAEYIFGFYNINPATDDATFQFQVNVDGESGYNETITSSSFYNFHWEADDAADIGYLTAQDQAEGTAFQDLHDALGNDADASVAGMLHIFNPSGTTYVKHFLYEGVGYRRNNGVNNNYVAGYINATGAVDDIQFKMSSGNFDGEIKVWGVK